ncbi:MAG: transposase [Chloroflexota bacterium]
MGQRKVKFERRRKSIRLKGWDYRNAGAYFVTICSHNRELIFGNVSDGRMRLNDWGQIVVRELKETERKRDNVMLDEFICMPNHVHIIFWLLLDDDEIDVGVQRAGPIKAQHAAPQQQDGSDDEFPHVKPKSLGATVRGFKSAVTNRINLLRDEKYPPVWQRGYHDRIIRNEAELNAIRAYIRANPENWHEDHEWNEGLNQHFIEA